MKKIFAGTTILKMMTSFQGSLQPSAESPVKKPKITENSKIQLVALVDEPKRIVKKKVLPAEDEITSVVREKVKDENVKHHEQRSYCGARSNSR